MTTRTALLTCLGILLLVSGCAQRETDIGANAIVGSPTDTFLVATVFSTASADFAPRLTNGYGPSLQVGEALGLFSCFAVQFNLPAVLPDSSELDSMRLRMHLNRVWPETGVSGLRVRIREISVPWQEDSIMIEQLADRASFPILDSLLIRTDDTLFFWDIPTSLWERWRTGDSTANGLLFEPQDSGAFLEFYSAEPTATGSTLPTTLLIRGTRWDEIDGVWEDTTMSIDATAAEDGFIVYDNTPRRPERFMVAQGLALRGALYFPMDQISSDFDRAVNRAELRLHADTLDPAQIRYSASNILFSHGFIERNGWIDHPSVLDSFTMGYETGTVGTWDATSSEYTLDVSGAVADWVANPAGNGGMQLITSQEDAYIARQVFYSHLAEDSTKRPKLIIWYTESPH